MMHTPRMVRISYLLRLWRTEVDGLAVWRALLQNTHTGERHCFPTVLDLIAFLEDQMGALAEESEGKGVYRP